MGLREIVEKIYARFSARNKTRDYLLGEFRKVLKATREAIAASHRDELDAAENKLNNAKSILAAAQAELANIPDLPVTGLVHNAEGEVVEAALILAFRKEEAFVGPEVIGVGEVGYLLGLGDFVGELRRVTIDALTKDNLALAKRAFSQMEEVYSILLTFDFPNALTPGLRAKTDVARRLVERTRADISSEIQRSRLLAGVQKLQKSLKN
jgi:translin